MPQLSLTVDIQNHALVQGFATPSPATLPTVFALDMLDLLLRFVRPTGNSLQPYADVDYSGGTVKTGIGTIGGAITDGTFTLTDPDAVQTTSALAHNISAADLQAAIRSGLSTNWSLATVSGSAGGPWIITNGTNGARGTLESNGSLLIPAAQAIIVAQQAGDAGSPSIQYVRLALSPIAYQNTWTPTPAATATVTRIQAGGTGVNEVQQIVLGNAPYAGTWTISFGGQTTIPLAYNASLTAVQSALQALSNIGSGNCTVGGIPGSNYIITFTGTKGGAGQALCTTDASALVAPLALTGSLALNTARTAEAIGSMASLSQTLEIEAMPSGGNSATVLQVPIIIRNNLIQGEPTVPVPTDIYLTESESDARYLSKGSNLSDVDDAVTALINLGVYMERSGQLQLVYPGGSNPPLAVDGGLCGPDGLLLSDGHVLYWPGNDAAPFLDGSDSTGTFYALNGFPMIDTGLGQIGDLGSESDGVFFDWIESRIGLFSDDQSIDIATSSLVASSGGAMSMDWSARFLSDDDENPSLDWNNRVLKNSGGSTLLGWANSSDSTFGQPMLVAADIHTLARIGDVNADGPSSYIDFSGPYWYCGAYPSNYVAIDVGAGALNDTAESTSVDWAGRKLYDVFGNLIFDFSEQASAIADATDPASTQAAVNSVLAALRNYGLIST